ncbi:UNVERIFIED_CONTAM: hypothetical protein Sindi_0859600 [Sesamum indicum]
MHESSQLPVLNEDSQSSHKLTARKRSGSSMQFKQKSKRTSTSGVNIRDPVPFSTNHPVVPPRPQTRSSFKGLVPTLEKDGKKYVSMSNLASLVDPKSKKK